MSNFKYIFLLFFTLFLQEINAQTYSIYGMGFKVKLVLVQSDTGINFNGTLYNNSDGEIYYSPSSLVSHAGYFTGIELGCMYYSFDVSHFPVFLRKLNARDSITMPTIYDGKKTHAGPIIVSFDCFVMNNHNKKIQKKFINLLKETERESYTLGYFDYYRQPVDLFRIELPEK